MCKPNEKRRFKAVYLRKFRAYVKYINSENAHDAAMKTAERITCIQRDEIFTS